MSENKLIKCAKCQNNAETKNRWDEYTTTYPIRDKDGKIYCWDCYKSFSCCKGCGESVANLKFPRSGQPEYPRCNGGYSVNCERISNEVKFICSKKCAKDIRNREYQAWKEKLNQGWTKCEQCVDLVDWVKKTLKKAGSKGVKKWEKEKTQSWLIKLVRPGAGKLCDTCDHHEKVEKPRQAEIKAQAQKFWDTQPYETRLKEVIRSGSVGWGKKFIGLTAEQIAAQDEVPRGIIYEFELKDCHRGCQDCHLDKDFQNSGCNNNLSVPSSNDNNSQNDNSDKNEPNRLSQESSENQNGKNTPGGGYSGLIIGGIIVTSLISLTAILLTKKRQKSKIC